MSQIINFLKKHEILIVIIILLIISFVAFYYYFVTGQNLLYADAISRLNIARKVVDNITPGLAQLGNVWLPLPQILMLPFIWNDYLWHSGIAGSIMSMFFFILGGLYIYKSAKIITNSITGSLFGLSVYALNINIVFLQTTAMSESLFLCTISATIYYLLMFFKNNKTIYLIPAAISVSAMTLTRYEGLAILLSSIPMIYIYSLIKNRKHSKAEANTIIYGSLACLGFALWTIYLTAIFGDPLYWKNYYATAQVTEEGVVAYTQSKPFLAAVWQYFTSTVWMVGLFPMLMAMFAIVIMIVRDVKNRTYYFLPLLMPLSIFLFMVLTLQRNTPIVQPDLNLVNIFSTETSNQTGFNIRYGLLLLPLFAILTSYLFVFRKLYIKIPILLVSIFLFSLQIYSYFDIKYSVIYQIPGKIYDKPYGTLVEFMKNNYNGGLILVSASSHEDQMFQMGFPYKYFIHEGNYKYWKETLDDPPRYATWVIIDKGHKQDMVARKKNIEVVLKRDYNLVFNEDQVQIYKIKKKPYFEIKT